MAVRVVRQAAQAKAEEDALLDPAMDDPSSIDRRGGPDGTPVEGIDQFFEGTSSGFRIVAETSNGRFDPRSEILDLPVLGRYHDV